MTDEISNEKSIEILELNLKLAGDKMPPDCRAAIERGIKALYYVQSISDFPHLIDHIPLPRRN